MPVDRPHGEYQQRVGDWESIRDALQGQRVVKGRRTKYLPPPPGMPVSKNELLASTSKRTTEDQYDFYLSFAEFPEIVEPALTGFQGIIHARNPHVELPPKMEYLLDDATPDGDKLLVLWATVTREMLSGGRIGLLADVSSNDDKVRVVTYAAENVLNWQALLPREGGGAAFVVLFEARQVPRETDKGLPDVFSTEDRKFWRELRLRGGTYQVRLWTEPDQTRSTQTTTFPDLDVDIGAVTSIQQEEPKIVPVDGQEWNEVRLFGKPFNQIPFLSVNSLDIGFEYGAIPMLPLVRRAFSVYRLTADYRRSLYQKGDPQPFISGIPKDQAPTKIGGEKLWVFENPEAKAAYLDVEGDGGIPMMRQAIQDDLIRFDQEGGRLLSTTQRPESGDALKSRLLAHQVTLRNVVINAGMGLERELRIMAVMMGEDPDTVVFLPDLDFAEPVMDGQTALEWAQARRQGFPVSARTLHDLAHRGGVTEKTFEEEKAEIEEDLESLVVEQEGVPGEGSAQSQPKDQSPFGEGAAGQEEE